MLGNIGDLLVKCMQQVTKGHLYHLLGVSDYCVMYMQRAQSVCERLAKINNWVTDPLRWFCNGDGVGNVWKFLPFVLTYYCIRIVLHMIRYAFLIT